MISHAKNLIEIPMGLLSTGVSNVVGWVKIGGFQLTSHYISEMVQDRDTDTIEC